MRQSNIEILRILATMMIVALHTSFYSLGIPKIFDTKGFLLAATQIFCIPAVNIFILISGYFGINLKLRSIGNYLFQVLFYSISIYLIFIAFGTKQLSLYGIKECFYMTHDDWFVKSYLFLLLISPVINSYLKNSSPKQITTFLLCFFSYELIFDCLTMADLTVRSGYSTISFIGIYILGYFIKHFLPKKLIATKKTYILLLFVLYSMMLTPVLLSVYGLVSPGIVIKYLSYGLGYNNPIIIMIATIWLILFTNINIVNKIINWLAVSSFAAFLIHINPNILPLFKMQVVNVYSNNTLFRFLIFIPSFTLSIFVLSVLMDKIRLNIWKLFWNKISIKYKLHN